MFKLCFLGAVVTGKCTSCLSALLHCNVLSRYILRCSVLQKVMMMIMTQVVALMIDSQLGGV